MIKGAFGGAASVLIAPYVDQLVKGMLDGTDLAGTAAGQSLANIVSTGLVMALTATVGGGDAAAYAGAEFRYNYLTHQQLRNQINEMAKCGGDAACINQVEEKYLATDNEQDLALFECKTAECVKKIMAEISEAKQYLGQDLVDLAAYSLNAANRTAARQLSAGFFSPDATSIEADINLRGAAYCERNPGDSCKLIGSLLADISDGLYATVYAKLAYASEMGQLTDDVVRTTQTLVNATKSVDDILKPNGGFVGTVTRGATPNIRTVSSGEFNTLKNDLLDGATASSTYAGGKGTWYDLPGGGRVGVRTSINSGVTLDIDIPGYPKGFKVHQQ